MRKTIKSAQQKIKVINQHPLALVQSRSVRPQVNREPGPAKESDQITLMRIIIEMDKPRIAKSARQEEYQVTK